MKDRMRRMKDRYLNIGVAITLIHVIAVLFAILLLSCSKADYMDEENLPTTKNIGITTRIENTTKVSGQDFDLGDNIGVYVVDYTNDISGFIGQNNNATNVKHTFGGTSWTTVQGEELYWTNDNTKADIYAYYPYDPEMSRANGKENLSMYPFAVKEDQSGGYIMNDFLWAKAENRYPTEEKINLTFSHSLSKVLINLTSDTEQTDEAWASLLIHNLKNNCLVNMNNGQATVTGKPAIITPDKYNNDRYKAVYNAIVIPQDIEAGAPLFSINIDGNRYIYETDRAIEFLPQKEYLFNVSVNTLTRSIPAISVRMEIRSL